MEVAVDVEKATVLERGRAVASAEARRDLDTVMNYWAEDAVAHLQGSSQLAGKESIRELMGGLLSSFKEFEGTTKHVEVAGSGDLAFEYGVNRVVIPGDGADLLAMGKYLVVWRKVDGEWLISALSITDDALQPAQICPK
jgi:uncharacterized protein (TIGR02246 family)